MSRSKYVVPLIAVLALVTAGASSAKQSAGSYTLVESATLVNPGYHSHTAAQVTSSAPVGPSFDWGAVNLAIPAGLTLGQLNNLSTDYEFVVGSCWGGSPRFEAWVTSPTGTHKVFFYIGPASSGWTGCPTGVWANTGNLASASSIVDDSQLGGGYDPYSTVQANYGSYPVTAVYLDADGGWSGAQSVDFDNTQVNSTLYTYER